MASTNIPSDWLLLGKLLVRLLDSSVLGERLALHVVVGIVHVGGVLRVGHWLGLLHGVLIVLVHLALLSGFVLVDFLLRLPMGRG